MTGPVPRSSGRLQPLQFDAEFLHPLAVQRDSFSVHIDHVCTTCDPFEDGANTGSEIEASLNVTVAVDGIVML